jgi:DNA/RNA endonuclease YhcR with UshA esterase domain
MDKLSDRELIKVGKLLHVEKDLDHISQDGGDNLLNLLKAEDNQN